MAGIDFAFFLIVLALLRNHGEEIALRRIKCGGSTTLPSLPSDTQSLFG
jgi:hypothetical protein